MTKYRFKLADKTKIQIPFLLLFLSMPECIAEKQKINQNSFKNKNLATPVMYPH